MATDGTNDPGTDDADSGSYDEPLDLTPAEVGYVVARLGEDYSRCLRELLGMTLWLPVKGPRENFIVTRRGDHRLIRAYTSPVRVTAVAAADVDPANAVAQPFSELLRRWADDQVGLVVNPDSDTELQLPPSLFPEILELRRRLMADPAAHPHQQPGDAEPATGGMVPIEPPARIGGFRFARLVDGVDDAGRPVISPRRPRVTDPAEKSRIRGYLAAGAVLQAVAGRTHDAFSPEKGEVVPSGTRTDGTWMWSEGLGYYLDDYDIGPERDFYDHIVAQGYRCPSVPDHRLRLAGRALTEQQRITADLYQRWYRERADRT